MQCKQLLDKAKYFQAFKLKAFFLGKGIMLSVTREKSVTGKEEPPLQKVLNLFNVSNNTEWKSLNNNISILYQANRRIWPSKVVLHFTCSNKRPRLYSLMIYPLPKEQHNSLSQLPHKPQCLYQDGNVFLFSAYIFDKFLCFPSVFQLGGPEKDTTDPFFIFLLPVSR